MSAETAPNDGPNRMATGSGETRPRSSGETSLPNCEFTANAATPHRMARPKRRAESRSMATTGLSDGRLFCTFHSAKDRHRTAQSIAIPAAPGYGRPHSVP